MDRHTTITVHKLTPTIGAEVRGVDLACPLSPAEEAELREAFLDNQVLFFRDQKLTDEQHITLGRRFGSLHVHPLTKASHNRAAHPELLVIHADENSKRVAGEDWHTDVSCEAEPPMASLLYLTEVPPAGGDTLWASMYAAYEALSPAMQVFLGGLTAVHDGAKPWVGRYGYDQPQQTFPRNEHPVIAVHPETGRKLLFVNRGFTTRITQLKARESDAMLEFLYRHIEQPLFQCRFRWSAGSLALWDNRCTQHHAMWDYFPQRRHGHRVTINGARPVTAAV